MGTASVWGIGTRLPELSKPASAEQILSGYQAIGQDGATITGIKKVKDRVQVTFKNTTARDFTVFYDSGSATVSGGSERLVSLEVPQVVVAFHQGSFNSTGGISRFAYATGQGAYANYDVSVLRVRSAGTATV